MPVADPSSAALRRFGERLSERGISICVGAHAEWGKAVTRIVVYPPENSESVWTSEVFERTIEWSKPAVIFQIVEHLDEEELESFEERLLAAQTAAQEGKDVEGGIGDDPSEEADRTGEQADADVGDLAEIDLEALASALLEARGKVGHLTYVLHVSYSPREMLRVEYEWSPEWFASLSTLPEIESEAEDGVAQDWQHGRWPTPEEFDSWGEAVSRDLDFQRARRPTQQYACVSRLLGDRYTRLHQIAPRQIVQIARDKYEKREGFTDTEIESLARRVASNEAFQLEARISAQRALLEELLGAECMSRPGAEKIYPKASAILELEVKPELERVLRERVERLAASGRSERSIADELGQPLKMIRRLLRPL